jgi:mono/diheme cytochrome c family protein
MSLVWSASRIAALLWVPMLLVAVSGCRNSRLPERDTYAGQLYIKRCGQCHQPFNPHTMTPAMWQVQVTAAEARIHDAGMPPLTPEQRKAILDYLTRNAGNE